MTSGHLHREELTPGVSMEIADGFMEELGFNLYLKKGKSKS